MIGSGIWRPELPAQFVDLFLAFLRFVRLIFELPARDREIPEPVVNLDTRFLARYCRLMVQFEILPTSERIRADTEQFDSGFAG